MHIVTFMLQNDPLQHLYAFYIYMRDLSSGKQGNFSDETTFWSSFGKRRMARSGCLVYVRADAYH
jgi:hypothetical protein